MNPLHPNVNNDINSFHRGVFSNMRINRAQIQKYAEIVSQVYQAGFNFFSAIFKINYLIEN